MRVSFRKRTQNNACYVLCVIRVNKTTHQFYTGIKLKKPSDFTTKPYKVKGDTEANNLISKITAELVQAAQQLDFEKIAYTSKQVYQKWQNSYQPTETQTTFKYVLNEWTSNYDKKVKANLIQKDSARRLRAYARNFMEYFKHIKKENILISEIKRGDFEKISLYFFTEKKFKNNHIAKMMSCLKGFLDFATDNDYLQKNPFNNLSIKKIEYEPIYLDAEELKRIEDKDFENDRLNKIKDLFLFACYTGLAFIDTKRLSKKNIIEKEGRLCIDLNRQKTKNLSFIPLIKKAQDILEKYDYDLKVLSNGKYNAYLKEIQNICNIKKLLTTHVARKTFINLLIINEDFNLKDIGKIVGHENVETTLRHYTSEEAIKKAILKSFENLK